MKTDKLLNYLFYFSVLIFFIGFNFRDNPQGGWQLQTIPELGGRQISDIAFTDSVTGYAVTNSSTGGSYILKTTNGGDNWQIKYVNGDGFQKVKFINSNTGYANAFLTLFKTTNGGDNWITRNLPGVPGNDMFVLNEDTIWIVFSESLVGGVFRTTNGGQNWTQQLAAGNQNPEKIYMYNARIGFIGKTTGSSIRKTTNGGFNWFSVVNQGFSDMYFSDSLKGWRNDTWYIHKTTDGGLNWINIPLPTSGPGYVIYPYIISLSGINEDTIWASGGFVAYPNNQHRGHVFRTTNGGNNWHYQIPDTSFGLFAYYHIQFINKLTGWAYLLGSGIHTTTGGDTNFLTDIKNNNINELPEKYKLYQNYPNPFNSMTNVKFQMLNSGFAEIKVFDISGKMIKILTSRKYNSGEYTISFDAGSLSNGIYFYSLIVDGKVMDTKKAILSK